DLSPLSGLPNLQQVYCFNTQVSDLSPLSGLPNLQQVDCGGTQVSDLSPLTNCHFLSVVSFQKCLINKIFPDFIYKKSLTEIDARESIIKNVPHDLLKEKNSLPHLRAHFADLAQGASDFPGVKLLLLGNGGVGKTQIARWLSGEPFDPEWDSTHGIRVVSHPRDGSLAADFHLQIWDFGGQEIYHGTHALFLRGPAILMAVWATSREIDDPDPRDGLTFRNHPLTYWLDIVRHQASPGNPVLIVQNQCDHPSDEARRFPIPSETLDALPTATEIRLSAKVRRGGGALRDALTDATTMLRDPARVGVPQIGAGRLRVIRRLEALRDADMALPAAERRHRLLTQAAYRAICAEEGGVSSPELLLDFLHASGTVFYRPGLFHDNIILDQGWALEKIYAVFDRKQTYKALMFDGGRFTRQKLEFYVWADQHQNDQDLLISMMRSCGICFLYRRFRDEDGDVEEYVAPDLLPPRDGIADQLAARWDEEGLSETVTISYGLLHGGLIRSIMSEIGEMAGCDGLYWRGGFCAYEATTRSRFLIEQEMTGDWAGRIHVRTQSGRADLLLARLMALIERVQDRLAMRPTAVERPVRAPAATPRAAEPLIIEQEKPAMPEWYVSYAWGDDRTPEGRQRAEIVDQLCAAAEAKGHKILRDRNVLNLGDSISAFMRRLGGGDRVFVILSDKYLRSPNCMFELSEIWRTSRQEGPAFLDRVRVYALPDAKIWTPLDWTDWAIHWKQRHDELQSRAVAHGIGILGEVGGRQLRQMQGFSLSVSDILGTLTDIVQPRTFEELERYGLDDAPA
ncbi:COR domain-containing protein, partial [Methylobacterium aquaticum]|uniref:COR domain-containing protein n=1 Tax=Methylobacterium aquaticum TaxID=270351 RepID=UPI0009E22075